MKSNEALLLVNLGSPKNLDKKSVKGYLHVFLSDDYVVDIPKFIQQLILRLFILPFRPKQPFMLMNKFGQKQDLL